MRLIGILGNGRTVILWQSFFYNHHTFFYIADYWTYIADNGSVLLFIL